MKALLVIDFQRAIAMGDPIAHDLAAVRGRLAATAGRARSAGLPVVFIQHADDDPASLWHAGSEGHGFFPELTPQPGDLMVAKSACDGFRETALDRTLQAHGIDGLIIGGYASEYCVDTTIRAAASRGYRCEVMADAHTTRNRPHLDAVSIIRHHNWVWENLLVPGNPVRLVAAAEAI
jgi:nicotinamidase-related amidase